jgi:hypothetical protein
MAYLQTKKHKAMKTSVCRIFRSFAWQVVLLLLVILFCCPGRIRADEFQLKTNKRFQLNGPRTSLTDNPVPSEIYTDPPDFWFSLIQGEPAEDILTLFYIGEGEAYFEISILDESLEDTENPESDWLSVYPVTGSIWPEIPVDVYLFVETSGLEPGIYYKTILIEAYGAFWIPNVEVPVYLEVIAAPLPPPQNLQAELIGDNNVMLTWEPPEEKEVLYYNIYQNDVLMGNTTETNFLLVDLAPGVYNFKVTAVYDEGESGPAGPVEVTIYGSPEIVLSHDSLYQELFPYQTTEQSFYIYNTGDADLNYSLDIGMGSLAPAFGPETFWLEILSPGPGTVAPGDSAHIDVLINAQYANYGLNETFIEISNNSPVDPVILPVSLNVVDEFPPPLNFQAVVVDTVNVLLNWDAPQIAFPIGYNIYRDDEIISTVVDTSFLDIGLITGTYEYKITAWYPGGESQSTDPVFVAITDLSQIVVAPEVLGEFHFDPPQITAGELIIKNEGETPLFVWIELQTNNQADNSFVDDIGVVEIIAPSAWTNVYNDLDIVVVFKNFGTAPQANFPYQFSWSGPYNGNHYGIYNDTLFGGEEIIDTLPWKADFSANGLYHYDVCTLLENDQDTDNNCSNSFVSNPRYYFEPYCSYTSGCYLGDGLIYWDLANITVPEIPCEGAMPYYHNYTNMIHYLPSGDYQLTVQDGYGYQYFDVWIDYNDDFTFSNEDELVIDDAYCYSQNTYYTFPLNIPLDASPGLHYMRVRTNYGQFVSCPTCTYAYGNCCDFKVFIPDVGQNDWLSVNPLSGIISPGDSMQFFVAYNSYDLLPGDYLGSILVHSNDPVNPIITIPVTLFVGDCPFPPPQNLVGSIINDDEALLQWEPPQLDSLIRRGDGVNADGVRVLKGNLPLPNNRKYKNAEAELLGYNIYRDAQQINSSLIPDTFFIELLPPPGTYEFYVTAVYDECESEPSNSVIISAPPPMPEILVVPDEFVFELETGLIFDDFMNINNIGFDTLEYSIAISYETGLMDDDWLTISPFTGSLPEGYMQVHFVQVNTTGLIPGGYNATIGIVSNDPDNPVLEIPVSLTVLPSTIPPPQNLQAEVVNINKIELSWDPPAGKPLLYYNIYIDGALIGNTANTTYYSDEYEPGIYTFMVSAVYSEGESEPAGPVEAIIGCPLPAPQYFDGIEIVPDLWQFTWEPPEEPDRLRWDSGENAPGLTLPGGGAFSYAARWGPAHLQPYTGYFLSHVEFFPKENPSAEFVLKVWKGANAANLILEQPISGIIPEQWNTVKLDRSIEIDVLEELWIGFEVYYSTGNSPAGHDYGPATAGYGDLISLDGVSWDSMSIAYGLDFNWNIAGILFQFPNLDFSVKETFGGYNFYRDSIKINTTIITETIYTDSVPAWGHCYHVSAVYDGCEAFSDPWATSIGISENTLDEVVLFPNPATNEVFIRSKQPFQQVRLLSLLGKVLVDKSVGGNETRLDVSELNPGVYIVEIKTENAVVVRKLVVE